MKTYLEADEWKVIEKGFHPEFQKSSESIFSLGNGLMGQRANFEEQYSGPTFQGSYIAGIYYPDKTRVGWWKNGYPEYFTKVINSPNWIGVDISINGHALDLHTCKVLGFERVLDMKQGVLSRNFTVELNEGKKIAVNCLRFLSMAETEIGAIKYSVTPLNFDAEITFTPYLDGDVVNKDSNYDEQFWDILLSECNDEEACLLAQTKKLGFLTAYASRFQLTINGKNANVPETTSIQKDHWAGQQVKTLIKQGEQATLYKYVAVCSSLNHDSEILVEQTKKLALQASQKGFNLLLQQHIIVWEEKWAQSDIRIEGDVFAQQGIRFNIFQLNQTYTGNDPRLNIGPKGFTGEKYGGSTYWDTEAYCVPFYISTSPAQVTKNLLLYRFKQLPQAIENATKLGFKNGAALFPMVTMNGEECHNEWEITFEEIHRNGAIAFAIHNYVRHTGDKSYLADYGLEVLLSIARFWSQRVHISPKKQKYVMLGVTGPNEYENNINNNWYTNRLAVWCLAYTRKALAYVKENHPDKYSKIIAKTSFQPNEVEKWQLILDNMYFPYDEERDIFLQQDDYLDKEAITVSDLNPAERPINQHWSWDRILRSPFIKQADTLQGIYLFEEEFDTDFIKRHFEFYEPKTVHESSLSPCIHSVLAARIGNIPKAYEMYLRTSRLDLDDYNHEADEGLHITSMAGTWMAIVEGFGGKRVYNEQLYLNPIIPEQWTEYAFRLKFMEKDLNVSVGKQGVEISLLSDAPISLFVYGNEFHVEPRKTVNLPLSNPNYEIKKHQNA